MNSTQPNLNPSLNIGGLTPLSTLDYPGQLSAVIFCQGCPWRCRYCHNPELLPTTSATPILWADVMAFLYRRHDLLDAVVFSGGEPTYQDALASAMHQVLDLGYKIGLHTSGYCPQRLKKLLPLIDWIGLDIKAPQDIYHTITGITASGAAAWASADAVLNSGKDYEIRITLHPSLVTPDNLEDMLTQLKQRGASKIVVQPCCTPVTLDPTLPPMPESLQRYQTLLHLSNIVVR